MHVKRMLLIVAAVATTALAGGAGAASADDVPGCGNGLELQFSPSREAFLADAQHGNVNGDGYVCFKLFAAGSPVFGIIVDNNVQA